MFGLGTTELIIIAVIVLLLFGAKRLPEIGKGVGGAIREFKHVKKEIMSDADGEEDETGKEKDPPAIENKLAEKVMEQVPGVKQAMDAKKKAEKVKDILKS
ncbi:MAG: Sec-independent protein translocase subunit TatA/TatB [Desulfatiglandales bacterium]